MPWWKRAVIYQIYPRSFADSNGDGVGDLAGIRAHLDHVDRLGVDAVWLSPFFTSPMADFGYDVADHCDVDPLFGTLDDFDALLADAHARGLRVIIDWVPNHTSDRHPWFAASRSSRHDPRRDWYVWRDPAPDGGPPNNWRAAFTGDDTWIRDDSGQLRPRFGLAAPEDTDTSAWSRDDTTGQYYLHSFLPEQPDLNWRNPEVVRAMHGTLRFWLDRGVDGFRVDAISSIGKPADLRDAQGEWARFPGGAYTDEAFVHQVIEGVRDVLDEYGNDRMMVGEVGGIDVHTIARHVGDERFHLAFNFPPMYDRWRADRWRRHIDATEAIERHDLWPAWVLSNHDNPRHADRFGTEDRARAAAVLLLTLRGTPFCYMGEELGLIDADVPASRAVDPGGRDGCRAPMPWTAGGDHGWPAGAWLPFPDNAATHAVDLEERDGRSMLHLYRRLLAARGASPALAHGTFAWVDAPDRVLAWRREAPTTDGGGTDVRVVIVNMDPMPTHVPLDDAWSVEVSSTGEAGADRFNGLVAGDQALLLRPA